MYRSIQTNLDLAFSILETTGDHCDDVQDDAVANVNDSGSLFPEYVDRGDATVVNNSGFTVAVAADSYLPTEQDIDSVNSSAAGHLKDSSCKVKDSRPGYSYLNGDCKQDLDFSNFEAHIHKTSSVRDLSEFIGDSGVISMAPVITLTSQASNPKQAGSWRNLPPDMLGKKSGARGQVNSSGFSTPTGSLTPTGMQTPSGMRTPSGMQTPSGMRTPSGMQTPTSSTASVLRKSSSVANLIHYHTLESVSISDLYSQQGGDMPPEGAPGMNINLNAAQDKEFGKHLTRAFYRNDKLHGEKKYKSHSCPHSRHHSPPRQQWHRIETVKETDSLPDLVTTSGGGYGNAELKDVNFNDTDDIKIINQMDDNLNAGHADPYGHLQQDESYSRHKSASPSFAALFSRCRYERDTSVPNTPCEGDGHEFDPEQLMNRVNFLCAERVSQMTKTYNDIEAVTRLLEEKERDLELAARIGQTLLSKNKELSTQSEILEEQLSLATEKVSQLQHDVVMKDELLRIYNEDLDNETSGDITPNDRSGPVVNVDFLEKKVRTLEDENVSLRMESAQLKSATDSYEDKEKRLVEDCIQQLAEVNLQVESLAEELHLKVEENTRHKEEITSLLAQIADLQTKIRKLTLENMDIHEKLTASNESHRKLTKELGCMQDKYDELFEMLEEAQDELRLMRGKHKVHSSGQHHHSAYSAPADSLASELETSLQQELSQTRRRSYSWKVFETARAAKRAAAKAAQRELASAARASVGPFMLRESDSQGPSAYPSDVESLASDGYSADMDSLYGSNPELGQPGIPGSNDLESALKRLAMRKVNEHNERDYHEEEEERRRRKSQATMSGGTSPFNLRSPAPNALHSPAGSVSSSHRSSGGMPGNNHHYKLSEKLQIVKPMEGSMTLRHWQHLATPHLGGIFEERSGVQIKGEKKLDLVEEVYSLSDFEEDDDPHDIHTQKEPNVNYTFTDSMVQNPIGYRGQGSLFGTSTPVNTSADNDHASFNRETQMLGENPQATHNNSMPLGLASLLQGRETTEVGRALLRVSALKSARESSASSTPVPTSDINQNILSARSFGNYPGVSSSLRSIPGSRSFDQAMKEYDEKRRASLESKTDQKSMLFAPGMTGKGFLQQLKSKGYSLYGLWAGGAKDADNNDDVTTGPVNGSTPVTKTASESVFSNGSGVGVLGALTNFRRNGMF